MKVEIFCVTIGMGSLELWDLQSTTNRTGTEQRTSHFFLDSLTLVEGLE